MAVDSRRTLAAPVPAGDAGPGRGADLIDTRNLNVSPISIHPDGRQIAYLGGEQKKEVWVLENFLPGK